MTLIIYVSLRHRKRSLNTVVPIEKYDSEMWLERGYKAKIIALSADLLENLRYAKDMNKFLEENGE